MRVQTLLAKSESNLASAVGTHIALTELAFGGPLPEDGELDFQASEANLAFCHQLVEIGVHYETLELSFGQNASNVHHLFNG